MAKEIPYLGSWKGRIIKSIAVDGARTWNEVREKTGLNPKTLNRVLKELFDVEKIRKIKVKTGEDSSREEYRIENELYKQYLSYFKDLESKEQIVPSVSISEKAQKHLISWIDSWQGLKGLNADLENKHFYLSGRHLDELSKELIEKAEAEVLVVNPYVKDCDLTNSLRIPASNKKQVTIIARHDSRDEEFHKILKEVGIDVFYNQKVHAKLIAVDRTIAISSSMNFFSDSSAGKSWEAGLISIEPTVVEEVVNSILAIMEMPESKNI